MAEPFLPKKAVWVNAETGEKVEGYVSLTRVERKDFDVIYFSYLFNLFDRLGGQKYKVLKYILEHKSYDNVLVITNKELAKAVGVSSATVYYTLNMLREECIIKTRTGAIIVNSRFTIHGSKSKEDWIFHKFEVFDQPIE